MSERDGGAARVRVATESEFDDPGREIVTVGDAEVGVFLIDGAYYAVRNQCAHEGGPVCMGEVRNELEADPGEAGSLPTEAFTGAKTVSCPWHGYTYRLETGEHVGVDDVALQTYEVVVEDGVVYVEP